MEISDFEEFTSKLKLNPNQLKVVYFYSDGISECQQMSDVVEELINTDDYKDVVFFKVNAVKSTSIVEKFSVDSVPTFIFYMNAEVERLIGADVPKLVKQISLLATKARSLSVQLDNREKDLNSRLHDLINKAPCMLFMKGSRDAPRCGFSKQIVELLSQHDAKYETFDILQDMEVREGLKKYSNWPTYPQLYVNGELIGGLDIVKELAASDELTSLLPKS